jgi:diguanylate cyclase (GGDEF)-like protein/PAS domain S-box-containing protein
VSDDPGASAASKPDVGDILSYVAEHVHDYAIFLMHPDGTIYTWNKAAEIMKGYTAEEAIGQFLGILYTEDDRARGAPQHNLDMAARNGAHQEEAWRRRKDGTLFWALIELIAIRSTDNELIAFCKITRDLTTRKVLEDRLAAAKERAEVTLAAIGETVITVDADGAVDYLNPRAEQLTGWTDADAKGHSLPEVFCVTDETTAHPRAEQLVTLLRDGRSLAPISTAVLTSRDGRRVAIEDTAAPIELPAGQIAGGTIVFRDVTDSRERFKTISYQATHDALTGLANRIEFEKCLTRSLERARRSKVSGALLYMDLDRFKLVNDTCGHDAGDQLLKQLATLYRDEIRERDVLARLGGDEFALVADHCTEDEAYRLAEKILESTRHFRFLWDEREFEVGVSIGLAMFDESTHDLQEITRLADEACYNAKKNGRNQIICAPGRLEVVAEKPGEIHWFSYLADAIRLNRFELHYQPIVAIGTDRGRLHF